MPTIVNRSKIEVSVPRRPHLTRLFSYRNEDAIARYIEGLKAEGYFPAVQQLENCFQVLLRKVSDPAALGVYDRFAILLAEGTALRLR